MTIPVIRPDWPAPARVHACVTTRAGGLSSGPYSSLNLGAHVGDRHDAVAANRRRLCAQLELPGEPHWLAQVHGTDVVALDAERRKHTADAAYTRHEGVVCCIQTADCLPVFLADRAGTIVGLVHGGWRGLAAGVIEATVAAMQVDAATLMAWLGPAISQSAYEVGEEVRAACIERDPRAAQAFVPSPQGRWLADLYALARLGLARAGVTAVHGGGFCTFTESERFFSHRRVAPCGRMASLIWLASAASTS